MLGLFILQLLLFYKDTFYQKSEGMGFCDKIKEEV